MKQARHPSTYKKPCYSHLESDETADAFYNEDPAEVQEQCNASDWTFRIIMSHIPIDDQSWTK